MTRLLDLIVGIFVVIVAAPIMLVIALLITCDSPGPIIYGSPRVGKNGKLFRVLRFRTVDITKPAHLSMDERLTRVGGFIRNFSLDDLPNVFNVLKGELSGASAKFRPLLEAGQSRTSCEADVADVDPTQRDVYARSSRPSPSAPPLRSLSRSRSVVL